jgi:hypothetical protein
MTNPPCPPFKKGGFYKSATPSPPLIKGDLGGFALAGSIVKKITFLNATRYKPDNWTYDWMPRSEFWASALVFKITHDLQFYFPG